MDSWTGPLTRASRLSAKRAHLWMAGWTTLPVDHAPTHRPSAAHKPHRAPRSVKKSKQKPFNTIQYCYPTDSFEGGTLPTQTDHIRTIKYAQPSTAPKPVTFPKTPVTFAEIRSCGAGARLRLPGPSEDGGLDDVLEFSVTRSCS